MKLVRYLRSLDTIPKWLIFVAVTGTTWFFGQESWFKDSPLDRYKGPTKQVTLGEALDKGYEIIHKPTQADLEAFQLEWVLLTTAIVALVTYWALFGFKRKYHSLRQGSE